MRNTLYIIVIMIVVMFSVNVTAGEDTPVKDDSAAPSQAAGLTMGPTEQIKELAYLEGTWDVTGKSMDQQTGEWTDFDAVARYAFTAGGGTMQMTYEGEFMGMTIHGLLLQAFNRETGKWQTVWTDNIGSYISYMEGDVVDGNLVFLGEDTWQGQDYTMRVTLFNRTKTSYDWKMEQSLDGGETFVESMNATYTKR